MNTTVKNQKGFTLVELLIVIIILSVLAAMVVPQLRGSTDDAKLASLDTNLSSVRSAIELYFVQHENTYPGLKKDNTVGGVTATHATEFAAFDTQMTRYSDKFGNTSDTFDKTTFRFGPYIKKEIPGNPLPNAATNTTVLARTVTVDATTRAMNASSASDTTKAGWIYVQATGEFFANNSEYEKR